MSKQSKKSVKQPFVLTRGRISGVMCGYLVERTAEVVVLREARQVWRWRGANTMTALAEEGASLTEYTRIDRPAPLVELNAEDVGAVFRCSPAAEENLRQSRWL